MNKLRTERMTKRKATIYGGIAKYVEKTVVPKLLTLTTYLKSEAKKKR